MKLRNEKEWSNRVSSLMNLEDNMLKNVFDHHASWMLEESAMGAFKYIPLEIQVKFVIRLSL